MRPDAIHPHPLLQRKLSEAPGVSIMDQVGLSSGTGADTPTAGKLSQAKIKKLHLWEFPASPLVRGGGLSLSGSEFDPWTEI